MDRVNFYFGIDSEFLFHLYVAVQLGAFDAVVKQMLEDVQERLVYRTHIYIQTDITGYKPAPGDLAYPEKLEMMEVSLVCWNGFTVQHGCIDHYNK